MWNLSILLALIGLEMNSTPAKTIFLYNFVVLPATEMSSGSPVLSQLVDQVSTVTLEYALLNKEITLLALLVGGVGAAVAGGGELTTKEEVIEPEP